ncbi:MAG: acyltransferase [Clostridia bacterium]|nr:acyltransferase [Clostridia bacterium]
MITAKNRESGIETVKIIAILLIIVSHVVQTYSSMNSALLNNATTNPRFFILMIFMHLGILGNCIFIICSSWFLIGSNKNNKKKILTFIVEIFVISIIIMIAFLILGINIGKKDILKSFFPTLFANNWYMTCYILFLMITPFLNMILDKISKKQLLRFNLMAIILYWGISFIKSSFYTTNLLLFVTIFFIVSYFKKYCIGIVRNKKFNLKLLIISIIMFIALIFFTNIFGLKLDFMSNKVLHWLRYNNPLLLIIAFSLFCIFKNMNFYNKKVNYIASLTLYIYIIHENILVRDYLRKDIWKWIGEKFTYNNIIIETLIYAVILFIVSLIISIIYKYTIKKIIDFVVEKIYNSKLKNIYKKIEKRLLEIE